MLLRATCTMLKNKAFTDDKGRTYTGIKGANLLELVDESGNVVDKNLSNVFWIGYKSPFPTPPGGPWATKYRPDHSVFGRCFEVKSDKESEIFIHQAVEWSMGCLIVNKNRDGNRFYNVLLSYKDNLTVTNYVIDNRSAAEQGINPIDYAKIGKIT